MTPLPFPLGDGGLMAWRLDMAPLASGWDNGEGAFRLGGRWNSRGTRAIYCSIDPATAILEVAVHKGFKALDTVPHVLTAMAVTDLAAVHVVRTAAVPDSIWLTPGIPKASQQAFGDGLLAQYKLVLIPSVVSNHSWNLIFTRDGAAGAYAMRSQEVFALDTRLHPALAR